MMYISTLLIQVNDCWLPYGHQLKLITALMIVGYPNVEQIVWGNLQKVCKS